MIGKAKRLSTALWIEFVKRLPYIGLLLILLLLYQGFQTAAKVSENVEISRANSETNTALLEKISGLSQDNKKLSQDNKALSEQSNRLAEQSVRYQDCIARIFAKYTRDYQPVIIKDLEACVTANSKATILPVAESTPPTRPPAQSSQTLQSPQPSRPAQPIQAGQGRAAPRQLPEPPKSLFERMMEAPRGLLKILQNML